MARTRSKRQSPVDRPWIFLAIIGEQPAAIAAALKTSLAWLGKPLETHLLATAHVRSTGVVERLVEFVRSLGLESTVSDVSPLLRPPGTQPSVLEIAESLVARPDGRLVFFADPGLKYLVAALANRLGSAALYLHSDTRDLVGIDRAGKTERSEHHAIEDIGLDELLALYDLHGVADGNLPMPLAHTLAGRSIPPPVTCGLVVEGGAESVRFDLAVERSGWLYVAKYASNKEDVRTMQRLPNALNGLRPLVAICAPRSSPAARRAAIGGLEVFAPNAQSLRRWLVGDVRTPGQAANLEVTVPWPVPKRGRGGVGPPLVVWVGTDPSTTLQSLYTFTPRRTWLLFDSTTPLARRVSQRLRLHIAEVPCGDVQFIPSDHLGRGVTAKLAPVARTTPGVVFDVTPGTNAQACAVAALPGVRLWSHHSKEGVMQALDGTNESRPLHAADVLVQAQVRGGRLVNAPEDARAWPSARVERLGRLASEVSTIVRRSRGSPDWRAIRRAVHTARRSGVSLRTEPSGAWFEEVVGSLFVREGADEVWLNVAWAWRQFPRDSVAERHRDELDIVARWRTSYLVVSCKLSQPERALLDADAAATEAVAREAVARLAVPILVRPSLDPLLIEQRLEERRGAVCLDLPAISPPGRLAGLLDGLLDRRRTT